MKKATYKCYIHCNGGWDREYDVDTKSALKCAEMYGRCDGGEVVTVATKSGRILSRVRWTPEDGGRYYREYITPGEKLDF